MGKPRIPSALPSENILLYRIGTNRWRIGFCRASLHQRRNRNPVPKLRTKALGIPNKQSILKGDAPIIARNFFLNLTPARNGVRSATRPDAAAVSAATRQFRIFGKTTACRAKQFRIEMNCSKGNGIQTGPLAIRFQPVFERQLHDTRENNVFSPNPAKDLIGPMIFSRCNRRSSNPLGRLVDNYISSPAVSGISVQQYFADLFSTT